MCSTFSYHRTKPLSGHGRVSRLSLSHCRYKSDVIEEAVSGKIGMSDSRKEIREDVLRAFSRAANKVHTLWVAWTYPFASIGNDVSMHYTCDLQRSAAPYIKIGNRLTLGREVWLSIPNVSICDRSAIVIGDGCGIGRGSVISAKNQIHIEPNTILAPRYLLWITTTLSKM